MKYPTTRFVFDRKNTATKQTAALIQVEVLLQGKKKYISTGVKVYKDQWNDKKLVFNCNDMFEKNDRINEMKSSIDSYIQDLIRETAPLFLLTGCKVRRLLGITKFYLPVFLVF